MLIEGRPAMFEKGPDGKLRMTRQLSCWGTGVPKRNTSFKREWYRMSNMWEQRKFYSGIVPIFFDWTTRCSQEEYNQAKEYYENERSKREGIDSEKSKVQFRQHYPTTPEDMFLETEKTIVSREWIDLQVKPIDKVPAELKSRYGMFEPIFDTNKPENENSDVPFKIIGANWVPLDIEDDRVSTILIAHPYKSWVNRYWQGTDPINSLTGSSKMSSAIWDKQFNTPVAVVNHRHKYDPKSSYLQCLLLGLYYDTREKKKGITELVEANIGNDYSNYKDAKGFMDSLMYNSELPAYLQSGDKRKIGLENYTHTNSAILNKLREVLSVYGDRICLEELFIQLKTFVSKVSATFKETWEAIDKRYYFDDIIFSITYSYICSLSFPEKYPYEITSEEMKFKKVWKDVHDAQGNLNRVCQNVRMN
jgi:hypothetical protein